MGKTHFFESSSRNTIRMLQAGSGTKKSESAVGYELENVDHGISNREVINFLQREIPGDLNTRSFCN